MTTVCKVCICYRELNLLELSTLVYCLSPYCISIGIECISICFSICICLHIRVVFAEILRARRTTTLLTHFIYTINSFSVLAKRQTDGATFLARAVLVSVSVNISISVCVCACLCCCCCICYSINNFVATQNTENNNKINKNFIKNGEQTYLIKLETNPSQYTDTFKQFLLDHSLYVVFYKSNLNYIVLKLFIKETNLITSFL